MSSYLERNNSWGSGLLVQDCVLLLASVGQQHLRGLLVQDSRYVCVLARVGVLLWYSQCMDASRRITPVNASTCSLLVHWRTVLCNWATREAYIDCGAVTLVCYDG